MSRPTRRAAIRANILLGFRQPDSSSSSEDEIEASSTDDELEDNVLSNDSEEEKTDSDAEGEFEGSAGSVVAGHQMISRNGQELWRTQPDRINAQHRRHNILREEAGPTKQAFSKCGRSPEEAFKLFITEEMVSAIVKYTNKEGRLRYKQAWKELTCEEMYVFFGLLMLAGVYRSKNSAVIELWSATDGRPIFNKSMSRDRFTAICALIRFDDKDTREARRSTDKFAPLRQVFEAFAVKCRSSYKAGANVTVDEQLVTFRGRCCFKIYIPSKPGKYGMKVWILCDAETGYCINLQPYVGRRGNEREIGQGSRVVLELTDCISGSGRHITADNFFSSINLVRALLGRQLTYSGTMRKNKGEIPSEMLPNRSRQVESSILGFQDNLALASYVPKSNRSVILITSLYCNEEIVVEEKKKPRVIVEYNKCKGGVDTLDQVVRGYTCRRKCRRWPFVMFCNLLDIAAYNAYIIYTSIHPSYAKNVSHKRRVFLVELAKSLLPQSASTESGHGEQQQQPGAKGHQPLRCHICPRTKDRKTPHICEKCGKNVCREHARLTCAHCSE
jgi:hypothetical protein